MEKEQRKLMLHYWYVELRKDEWDGTEFFWARGVVSGHHKIQDKCFERVFIETFLMQFFCWRYLEKLTLLP